MLDPDDARLFRGDEPVPMTPRAFQVLCHLIGHAGRLVTKEELLDAIWDDVCVGDGSLKVCVREIRQALGDDARTPRFVETVHRRGYRFMIKPGVPPDGRSASPPPVVPALAGAGQPRPVGRDAELDQLGALLARASRGERQVVFVTGEPGGGKTTLVNAFLGEAARAGALVAVGQCFERFGAGEAYCPVLEALGQLGRAPGSGLLLPLLARHAPTWLVQMPWMPAATGPDAPARDVLGATADRMLREACELLEALTAEATLVLVLEDLHWSDYSTVDLVSALARRGRPARLLLLATYRPVEVILADHPLRSVKQELQARRACRELALEGLDERAVAGFLERRHPDGAWPADLPRWLLDRTEGNPLFLVNLVEDWESQGLLDPHSGRWGPRDGPAGAERGVPESVRALVEGRVERLGDLERRVLEAASVSGSEFPAAAVAAALDADELDVESICEGLARRHLILEVRGEEAWADGTLSGRYGFLHELYREVIYGRAPAARRARLHRKLGDRLEAGHGHLAAGIAAELAVHFELGRDLVRAGRYLEQAAINVARRFANREALAYLDHALDLADRIAEPGRSHARLALLERRGLVRRASNDLSGAAADFSALADCARGLGRLESELDAHFYLASAASWSDRDGCLAASDRALSLASRLEDPVLIAHTRGRAAYWNLLWRDWSPGDARAIASAAEAARGSGDRPMLVQHAGRHSYVLALASRYDEAGEVAAEASGLALELGDAFEYLLCHFYRAWALLHAGRWGEMDRTLAAASDIADRNGHRRWSLLLRLERAWLHEQALDFVEALDLCDGVLREADGLGLGYAVSFGLILRGFAHLGLRRIPEAMEDFRRIDLLMGRAPRLLGWVWRLPLSLGLAEGHLAAGELPEARREAERLCTLAARPGERTYLALGRRAIAEVALAEGDRERMREEQARMAASIEGVGIPLARWRVEETSARLSRRLGCPEDAEGARRRRDACLRSLAGSLGDGALLAGRLLDKASAVVPQG